MCAATAASAPVRAGRHRAGGALNGEPGNGTLVAMTAVGSGGGGGEAFATRFSEFYDACSADERAFLTWLLSFDPEALEAADSADVEGFGSFSGAFGGTKQMQESQMSYNVQYMQLQSHMQSLNRTYGIASTMMETKHGTVQGSIPNVR